MPARWFHRAPKAPNAALTGSRRRSALRRRPAIESLEGRQLLSTFTVSSEADSGLARDDLPGDISGWTVAGGSLRSEAYSTAGRTYTITFRATNPAGRSGICKTTVTVPYTARGL